MLFKYDSQLVIKSNLKYLEAIQSVMGNPISIEKNMKLAHKVIIIKKLG